MDVIVYIHGKGGSACESEHFETLFPKFDVIGFDYKSSTPWDAKVEFKAFFDDLKSRYDNIYVIANSIGAYFTMSADIEKYIKKAYFISPIVDMEKLILDMMTWANVTCEDLKIKKIIKTEFGEDLSWDYYIYVKNNPIKWDIETNILYGKNDNLISNDTMIAFSDTHNVELCIMEEGEHWFHTKEQFDFLDKWIMDCLK